MEKPNFDNMSIENDSILLYGKTAEEIEKEEGVRKDPLSNQDLKKVFEDNPEETKKVKVITLAVTDEMFLQLERAAEFFECSKQEFIRNMLPGCLKYFEEDGHE